MKNNLMKSIIFLALIMCENLTFACDECITEIQLIKHIIDSNIDQACVVSRDQYYYRLGCYNGLSQCEEIINRHHLSN
jgi:hypothetical protein